MQRKNALHLASVFVYIVAVLLIGGCLDMIFLDLSVPTCLLCLLFAFFLLSVVFLFQYATSLFLPQLGH